jgi:murein DD-endopeptidase / murein LD-carboxypeptidase
MTLLSKAEQIAAFATSQIGVPFRLHGRSPGLMLDCAGLIEASLRAAGCQILVPLDYSLRGDFTDVIQNLAATAGLIQCENGPSKTGDIVLAQCGPQQMHLLVATASGHVHAHAGLRRVVVTPGPVPWPILQIWRGSL